jgi:hypothetical protein
MDLNKDGYLEIEEVLYVLDFKSEKIIADFFVDYDTDFSLTLDPEEYEIGYIAEQKKMDEFLAL